MKKIILLPVILVTLVINIVAAQSLYIDGRDYQTLPLENQLTLTKPNQKEVIEFFAYTCPHCYHAEENINKWLKESKPADVTYYPIPATGGNWTHPAKTMFVAKKLGILKEFHMKMFKEFQVVKNRGVAFDKEVLFKFINKEFNIDEETYNKAYDSFAVKTDLNKATKKFQKSGVQGTPAFIVNGKYKVSLFQDRNRTFEVINHLLSIDVMKIEEVKTEVKTEAVKKVEEVKTDVKTEAVKKVEEVKAEVKTEVKTEAVKKVEEVKAEAVKKVKEVKAEAVKKVEEVKAEAVKKVKEVKAEAVKKVEEVKAEAVKKVEEVKTDVKTEAVKKVEEVKAEVKVN